MSVPSTSRAYRLPDNKGIDSLVLGEVPVSKPKSNEVVVKVDSVSLQFRDLMIAAGKYPLALTPGIIPASDAAGTIAAVGESPRGWSVGDRVSINFALDHIDGDATKEIMDTALGGAIDGVLREYITVPVHSLVRVPDSLSLEEASTLPCAALTAYNALNGPTPVKAGDTVLIIGTGGVSIFGLQLATAAGAEVIALSSSDEKLEKAKALGAKHLINYKTVPNWDEEVLKITNGRGVDHVIEVGGAGTLLKSINSIKYAGSVHVIGFVAGSADVSKVPGLLVSKAAILRGILIGSVRQFNEMNRAITANGIKPVVDKVFPFEEAKEAYSYLQSQKHVGKVVIKVAKN